MLILPSWKECSYLRMLNMRRPRDILLWWMQLALPRGQGYVVPYWFTSARAIIVTSYLFWQKQPNLGLMERRWARIFGYIVYHILTTRIENA
jgi:hypothetical protein